MQAISKYDGTEIRGRPINIIMENTRIYPSHRERKSTSKLHDRKQTQADHSGDRSFTS